MRRLRYLLLQTRNPGDPMAAQEVRCFAQALDCGESAIRVFDLIGSTPSLEALQDADMLLLGGSGHYSVATSVSHSTELARALGEIPWMDRTLDALREIYRIAKPTFASCWGFQAMARAMGGECVNDIPNAEVGTIELRLTDAGRKDPVFGALPLQFTAQAGHEDRVVRLPPDAELLASSHCVLEQAFCFKGKPIYCTQFHPELDRVSMLERVIAYPEYIARIAKISFDEFVQNVGETPEANSLLCRFVDHFFA